MFEPMREIEFDVMRIQALLIVVKEECPLNLIASVIIPLLLPFSINTYTTVDFLFVDSHRNHSLSNLFSIDSQGFIRTSIVLDRELQSNHNLSIYMYDPMLKSYSLPTYIIVQVIDENDNLPYEPFLSKPFDLSIEQFDNEETLIYEFKPIDLDEGPNGLVSIDCLNCSALAYFTLRQSNATNSSLLITKPNITVPDGIYTLAIVLHDHGLIVSRERLYALKFNLTHRISFIDDEPSFVPPPSVSFFLKQEHLLSKLLLDKFQWHFLLFLLICWFILVAVAIWTCYRYERISNTKQKEAEIKRQEQRQFEIQVRQHEIVGQAIQGTGQSSSFPISSQQLYEKETVTHDDDEIEDTSYDADHIMTDANFVLTSGCAGNEPNVRYVSSTLTILVSLLSENVLIIQYINQMPGNSEEKRTFDLLPVFMSI